MSDLRYTDYLRASQKAATINSGTNDEGGFAIPSAIASGIIMAQEIYSPIRQIARVTMASTPTHNVVVSTGDATSGFASEISTRTATTSPEITLRSATFGDCYARPLAYNHVLEDASYDVSAWLSASLVRAFNKAEGLAFLNGTGTDSPTGMLTGHTLTASSAYDQVNGKYAVINSGADGAFGATAGAAVEFLQSMQDSIRLDYLATAKWMMPRSVYRIVSQLLDPSGAYLMLSMNSNTVPMLLGHEVVFNDLMDAMPVATSSVCPIIFGSFFDGYNVVDRTGLNVLRDEYSTHGQTGFYTRKRVGSTVLDAKALVLGAVSKV